MWEARWQRGFTLFELVLVVLMMGLIGLVSYSTLLTEMSHQQLLAAVKRAKIIATAIDNARRSGEVPVASSITTLAEFKLNQGNTLIQNHMPELNNPLPVLGKNPDELFHVQINNLATLVSFTVTPAEFYDSKVYSAGKTLVQNESNQTVSVMFTVVPDAGHGIFASYWMNQFINAD